MSKLHKIILPPVAPLHKLQNTQDVSSFMQKPEGNNLAVTAKALGKAFITIALMKSSPTLQQHSGDGGMVDMVAGYVIYPENFAQNILRKQLENLDTLKQQQPSNCLCFGNSQRKIDDNKKQTNDALKGYEELDPKSLLFHLVRGAERIKHQAANNLMILMRYNLDPREDYSTNQDWVDMAYAAIKENIPTDQLKQYKSKKEHHIALEQFSSAAFTQMIALYFLASTVPNKESFTQILQQVFSDLFDKVQQGNSSKIDWQTTRNTLIKLKAQVLEFKAPPSQPQSGKPNPLVHRYHTTFPKTGTTL